MSPIDQTGPPRGDPVEALARRTGFSAEAVEAMRVSMARGGGRMAQFDHAEFGGAGQWMQGGLLMIGEPSNHELKRRVDDLCDALSRSPSHSLADEAARGGGTDTGSRQWQRQSIGAAGAGHRLDQPVWYPASLGAPDASGTQNDLRYAWFAAKRRLAVDRRGVVTLFDTGDHRIAGVSQQQGAGQTLAFVSQHGDIDVDRLSIVDSGRSGHGDDAQGAQGAQDPREAREPITRRPSAAAAAIDPFVALEKLAELHARGIVDAEEFAHKKGELLKRI